jgi:hypothetical protein
VKRLGLWARANPLKVFLLFLVLAFLAFTAEQEIGGVGSFAAYFTLMFLAILLGVAYVRGGRR